MKIKISIITVCYNAENDIETTIKSVIQQEYNDIEYVIIDGGSTDNTIDLIKKYSNHIDYWCSEPDKGIYDAMNKGVKKCTGDYLIFMNAGDYFFSKSTLALCYNYIKEHPNYDCYYGNTVLEFNKEKYLSIPQNLKLLENQMIFCHQSCLTRRELQEKHPFNLNYKIIADYFFFKELYTQGHTFAYINLPIAFYEAENGVSSKMQKKVMLEYARIRHNNLLCYTINAIYIHIKSIIKKFVPKVYIDKSRKKDLLNNPLLKRIE